MTKRTPSMMVIRHNLFAPSYDLVKKWVEQPQTLDTAIIKKLEASTLAQQEKQAYLDSQRPEEEMVAELFSSEANENSPSQDVPIPDAILQLIEQRSKTAQHTFSQAPREGLMVLVGKGDGSADDLSLAMASPLVVMLDKESDQKNIWNAWMVATEKDYATKWDMLLDAKKDAPLDPLAGMVQVWNPLRINRSLIEKTVGELSLERLTELRKLNDDYKRTLAVSGETGISSKSIQQYQKMYREVASFINKKAVLNKSLFERWKTAFLSQAEKLGHCFIPVDIVNYAMGSETDNDKEKKWVLDNDYQFSFAGQKVGDKLLIEISIEHSNPGESQFNIEYKENGFLAHHATLSKQSNKTKLICDPDNLPELIIKDNKGKELHSLNLSINSTILNP